MSCKISIDCFDNEQLAEIEKELSLPLKNTGIQQKHVYPFNLIDNMVYLPFSYATTEWDILRPSRDSFAPLNAKFEGKLRDEQVKVKNEAILSLNKTGSALMSMYCGFGKCLGYDTHVLCYDGSLKKVQNIREGDILMGDDSLPRNVLSTSRGNEQMHRVHMIYGSSFTANKSHILSLCAVNHCKKVLCPDSPYVYTIHFNRQIMDYEWNTFSTDLEAELFMNSLCHDCIVDISIEDFLKLSPETQAGLLAYRVPVEFSHKKIHIDPYFLGLWLGMGNEKTGQIKTSDETITQYINKFLRLRDIESVSFRNVETETDVKHQTFVKASNNIGTLNDFMLFYGILHEKRIPIDYLTNTRAIRLSVLAGLIDSCGFCRENTYYIYAKSKRLCMEIVYLTRSLGFNSRSYYTSRDEKICYMIILMSITGPSIPVILDKNIAECKPSEKSITVMQFSLIPIEQTDYYGFEIDGNHRFLLGDFTVTHNTITSINLACSIGLKTMIVMNRIVLMNQWEKSINSVCPNAIVQKINNKEKKKSADFYIVNAINMPKMGDEWFNDIGTAIIDECFAYNTEILTTCGTIKIGELWKVEPYTNRVFTFNQKNKQFEPKYVTNTFRREATKKMLSIKFLNSDKCIECTEDHLFLTFFDGYKKAKDLFINEAIIATCSELEFNDVAPVISEENMQFILICIITGHLVTRIGRGKYTVNYNCSTGDYQSENIYDDCMCAPSVFYFERDNFDSDLVALMDKMDEEGLAVWYMKSYAYCHDDIVLVCDSSMQTYTDCILRMFEKYNISVFVITFENVIFFVIHEESEWSFEALVEPYMWKRGILSSHVVTYGCLEVESISEGQKCDYVYDIETEDNHNFVVCNSFGGVVVHNCHTIVAETLSKSLLRLTPRYLIGLSATPYRPDEMDSLIRLYFGENKIVRELFKRHIVYMVNTGFKPEMKYLSNGKINWGSILDSQANSKKRNDLIVSIITQNRDRNFLVLTKRVGQAQYLIDTLSENKESITNLVGNKQDYDPTARILVATIQKVSCGFDHAKLDTLLLAADTEEYYVQVLGRIFRTQETEPMVFDLVDDNPILLRHFELRREVYRKHGGLVKRIEYK